MSSKAVRGLWSLALLTVVSACAEEKADPDFVRALNPVAMGDGGAAGGDAGAGARADAGGGKKSDSGLDFAPFDDAVNDFIEKYNGSDAGAGAPIKGASAVIVDEKGVLHQQGYGDFSADRLYLIASASKILSVGVVMKLHDEKKLDIDEPIGMYLPEWGETKVGNVTAAQLFSNSSGLPTLQEVSGAATNPSSPFFSNLCQYNTAGTIQDCGKILYETEPPREPDTEFGYGGSQWQLGGALAEVASGKSWAELIEETYVKPCDVPSLGYTNQYAKSALGYPKNFMGDVANLDPAERDTANPNIEGGAYITAPDYAKLLMMHLNGGKCGKNQVLSAASVKRMQEDRVSEYGGMARPPFTGYGLGWWINETDGYVADPGAYGAFPWIDEKRGYAAIIMIEVSSTVGSQLALSAKPALEAVLDGAKK